MSLGYTLRGNRVELELGAFWSSTFLQLHHIFPFFIFIFRVSSLLISSSSRRGKVLLIVTLSSVPDKKLSQESPLLPPPVLSFISIVHIISFGALAAADMNMFVF